MPPDDPLDHKLVQRIRELAKTLGDLNARIVYIGGAIAPLLQTERLLRTVRGTKDVDAIAATASYAQHGSIQDRLRDLGFREILDGGHAHRWLSPQDIRFDLVPAGQHLGASGQEWDAYAVEHTMFADLGEGIEIKHPTAPAFLALKLAAYDDRGARDPMLSHDLEDIVALVVSRPELMDEIRSEDSRLVDFVARRMRQIVSHPDFEDLLTGNLTNAIDRPYAFRVALDRMGQIGGLGA